MYEALSGVWDGVIILTIPVILDRHLADGEKVSIDLSIVLSLVINVLFFLDCNESQTMMGCHHETMPKLLYAWTLGNSIENIIPKASLHGLD